MYQLYQSSSSSLHANHHCRSLSGSKQFDEFLFLLENALPKSSSSTTPIITTSSNSNSQQNNEEQQIAPVQVSQIEQQHQQQQLQNNIEDDDEEEEKNDDDEGQDESSDDSSEESYNSDISDSEEEEEEEEEDDQEESESESESEDSKYSSEEELKAIKKAYYRGNFSSGDSDSEDEYDDEEEEEESEDDEEIMNEFEDLIPNYSFNFTITPPKTLGQEKEEEEEYDSDSEEYKKRSKLLQLEKDKDILSGIRSSSPKPIKFIPTWFSNEDESHIKMIITEYQDYLFREHDIEEKCIRAPQPFIGRIHRRVIEFHQSFGSHPQEFTTLDTIKVFRWDLQPIGRALQVHKSFVFLTHWDTESGIPIKFQKVISLSNKELWQTEYKALTLSSTNGNTFSTNRSIKSTNSYIYCSPIFDSENEYQYSVDTEKYPIDYLPKSSPKLSKRRNFSHPSLLLSSKIYSHSLIPQDEFNHFKNLKNLDSDDSCSYEQFR